MIVICDNAPVHAALERVTEDEDFAGVRYLAAARALQRTAQPDWARLVDNESRSQAANAGNVWRIAADDAWADADRAPTPLSGV